MKTAHVVGQAGADDPAVDGQNAILICPPGWARARGGQRRRQHRRGFYRLDDYRRTWFECLGQPRDAATAVRRLRRRATHARAPHRAMISSIYSDAGWPRPSPRP
jgi:hypothetical protein